jgi:mono/diheme cytochrome c family protein
METIGVGAGSGLTYLKAGTSQSSQNDGKSCNDCRQTKNRECNVGSLKRYAVYASIVVSAGMLSGTSASAADAARGKQYAERVCSLCHAVSGSRPSSNAAAPPFRVIAASKAFRKKGPALIWDDHPTMPNLAFSEEEARDVAAYITSLKKRK